MTDKNLDKEYLGKIVALAKGGVGGEKKNAIALVKKLCALHNLEFKDVMNDTGIEEFYLDCKKNERQLVIQIICRYAHTKLDDKIGGSYGGTRFYFNTTKEKYIETLNAYSVLSNKLKEEKKIVLASIEDAFFSKHNLFYQPTDKEWKKIERERAKKEKEKTDKEKAEEEKKRKMAQAVMRGLDDVSLYKQLTAK